MILSHQIISWTMKLKPHVTVRRKTVYSGHNVMVFLEHWMKRMHALKNNRIYQTLNTNFKGKKIVIQIKHYRHLSIENIKIILKYEFCHL